ELGEIGDDPGTVPPDGGQCEPALHENCPILWRAGRGVNRDAGTPTATQLKAPGVRTLRQDRDGDEK
ncbi:MAG: hypothetical protein ACRDL7_04260, partial [Gaiellaceae bacterium]